MKSDLTCRLYTRFEGPVASQCLLCHGTRAENGCLAPKSRRDTCRASSAGRGRRRRPSGNRRALAVERFRFSQRRLWARKRAASRTR